MTLHLSLRGWHEESAYRPDMRCLVQCGAALEKLDESLSYIDERHFYLLRRSLATGEISESGTVFFLEGGPTVDVLSDRIVTVGVYVFEDGLLADECIQSLFQSAEIFAYDVTSEKAILVRPSDQRDAQGDVELYVERFLAKGVALKRAGRFDEAIEAYDRYLELRPESVLGWKHKGIALQRSGNYNEALECCDRALLLNADDGQRRILLAGKASALQRLGRPIEALECYDLALKFDPKWKTVIHTAPIAIWENKARLLNELGRYEEELACLDCVLELEPDNLRFWRKKARRLEELGRLAEADECWRRASSLERSW
jgi:tetratricopeptide (TPR) repeat protein